MLKLHKYILKESTEIQSFTTGKPVLGVLTDNTPIRNTKKQLLSTDETFSLNCKHNKVKNAQSDEIK